MEEIITVLNCDVCIHSPIGGGIGDMYSIRTFRLIKIFLADIARPKHGIHEDFSWPDAPSSTLDNNVFHAIIFDFFFFFFFPIRLNFQWGDV